MLDSALAFPTLIEHLKQPGVYPHPVDQVALLETHISAVLLAGEYAYKLKKPYNLGFLDFTTLEARKYYCEEEQRLNQRLAPDLYLGVAPITGSVDAPHWGGSGAPIEYAVKMRRFPQQALLSNVLARNELQPAHLDALACRMAAFHQAVPAATMEQAYGLPDTVHANARQNFAQIEPLLTNEEQRAQLARLARTTEALFTADAALFLQRKGDGFVRECHGDLHLGNLVMLEGEIVPFDCIEFNADFRWIDVMSEIAFLVMDLASRDRPDLAFRFLNAYLEQTGDFAGLKVLRYYLMFRAVVRAKVTAFRATQQETPLTARTQAWAEYQHYLDWATQVSQPQPPLLILMRGVSGSGKSTVARELAAHFPALHVRSDVERKRLFGLAPLAQSKSGLARGLYTADATQRTYARLKEIALMILDAGFSVVLDATFLKHSQRAMFEAMGTPCPILACEAPIEVLRARVAQRHAAKTDAAEADLAVLEKQLATHEALSETERAHTIMLDTLQPIAGSTLAAQVRTRFN